ncbi:MAG: toll/interleukin-1 receptor domain-containing protein [Desulfococcaceae bacterium]
MAFKYSCFISYCSGKEELIQTFIDQIYRAISTEIELCLKKYPVFLDRKRLQSGDMFDPKIASALCYSVCMVAVLTPSYYRQSYCLREYNAMEGLEKERFEKMNWVLNRRAGLILPIVLRGADRIPDIIKGKRQCLDFSRFTLSSPNILKETEFAEEIRKVAERINDFFENFCETETDLCQDCENFELPAEDKVPELRVQFKPAPKPFPFD